MAPGDGRGSVGRSVVDEQDLVLAAGMVLRGETVQAGGERAFGVVHRDDH